MVDLAPIEVLLVTCPFELRRFRKFKDVNKLYSLGIISIINLLIHQVPYRIFLSTISNSNQSTAKYFTQIQPIMIKII